MIPIKTEAEIAIMRECARIVRVAQAEMSLAVKPGITTGEINELGETILERLDAQPSFKGYRGYPAGVCISVNEEVVHGIPGSRKLIEGDIVSLDIGAFYQGFHGDHGWTYPVGEVSAEATRLLNVTRESLYQGIAQAREGKRIGDIAHAVQHYVERNGYSVVRDLVGHGIGRRLHEEPSVPNFGKAGSGPKLKAGMTLCVEPMINEGKKDVFTLDDHWTVVTKDGKLSAHFEHMILVTEDAPEILTADASVAAGVN